MSIFNQIALRAKPHSKFDLSHDVKTTLNMGTLVPILCQDIVPGDKFKVNTQVFARFAPMYAPIMQRVDFYVHYFFVPYRLIWDDFERFICGPQGPDVVDDDTPLIPFINLSSVDGANQASTILPLTTEPGCLADYLGIPVTRLRDEMSTAGTHPFHGNTQFCSLPFRAYQLIYNEYYRDQNLTDEISFSRGSGAETFNDSVNLLYLRQRSYAKDYFTSALPWVQRGGDVMIPGHGIDGADVVLKSATEVGTNTGRLVSQLGLDQPGEEYWGTPFGGDPDAGLGWTNALRYVDGTHNISQHYNLIGSTQNFKNRGLVYDPNGTLTVDTSNSSVDVGTINDLRKAIALQRWLETNARAGARYKEQVLSHFGVHTKDSRLDRPEFLGGGRGAMAVSETFQTSATDMNDGTIKGTPQGNLSGNASGFSNTQGFKRFFDEHGLLIGLLSFRPRASYSQGMPRYYLRQSRFDFYFPEFANLGEQAIHQNEIYWSPTNNLGVEPIDENDLFGYTPRYADFKFIPSSVHGMFRDTMADWHMGRIFEDKPLLNASFVEVSPTASNRVFFDQSADHKIWCQIFHHITASRPMPKFGTPSII